MKYCTYSDTTGRHIGVVDADAGIVTPLDLAAAEAESGILALMGRKAPPALLTDQATRIEDIHIEAPIPRPRRNIFCIGKNYFEHANEFAFSGFDSSAIAGVVPKAPIAFSKVPETVIAQGEAIRIKPDISTAIDYEAELAVIIGKPGCGIGRAEALDYIWGYTIVNDVTARDLQGLHSQWLIGKSQDTFCPMGPWAVTSDEFNLSDAGIRCHVNDELRQSSNTSRFIFDVPRIIEAISGGITLQPGDIIATGTPAGVGIGFKPPRYLKPGDRVRIEIDGIGVLENPVV